MARRKSTDPNAMAFGVRAFTEQMADPPTDKKPKVDPVIRAAAKALSKLGASKGGFARKAALSKRRRREIAVEGAKARWSRNA